MEKPDLPRVLYFCDVEPGNFSGGAVLMTRLWSGYPAEKLSLIVASQWRATGDKIPDVTPVVVDRLSGPGRFGWGRVRSLLEWFAVIPLALFGAWFVARREIRVVATIPVGIFFVAAWLAAAWTGRPLVVFLHDDWVGVTRRNSWMEKYFASWIFGRVMKAARVVYSISEPMRGWLEAEYGVDSEVLLPGALPVVDSVAAEPRGKILRIAFAGSATESNVDTLRDLMRFTLETEELVGDGWALEFWYYGLQPEEAWTRAPKGPHRAVFPGKMLFHEIARELQKADVLCLPFSFGEEVGHLTLKSMPTKASDYLASGKPLLVIAPEGSALVKYARASGFAVVICDDSKASLVAGLTRLTSPELRADLGVRARRAFGVGHDILRQRGLVFEKLREVDGSRNQM